MANSNHLISIITVVFNGEKYIEDTIKSVINQTYKNIEYIIIDGGSTDGTLDIIKKYESKIAFWLSEPDNGIYDAMNKGLRKAKGYYAGLINSDDFYEPDAVQVIVNEIYNMPDVDILFGNINIINPYLNEKKLQTYKKGQKLEKSFSIWHPSVFVRKSVYETYGYFDLSYSLAADYELLLRFYKNKCKFRYINKTISNFREGGVSFYNKNLIYERYRIMQTHTSKLNAYYFLTKDKIVYTLQKIFKGILGNKNYHNIRYKFLYK